MYKFSMQNGSELQILEAFGNCKMLTMMIEDHVHIKQKSILD